MVKGLDVFTQHFKDYHEQFILIGGVACDLAFDLTGTDFRATKDLDIVLCAEALSRPFVKALWDFIRLGDYEIRQKSSGARQLYRFAKPTRNDYPYMLEFFSRSTSLLHNEPEHNLTPMRIEDEVISLSAILLDNEHYSWILKGRHMTQNVPVIKPEYIIPLKARAWIDMTERKRAGEPVDLKNIKKHRNDVFRLLAIVPQERIVAIPPNILQDIQRFIVAMENEQIDFPALGMGQRTKSDAVQLLNTIYGTK